MSVRKLCSILAAVSLLGSGTPASSGEASGAQRTRMSNADVVRAIEREIRHDPALPFDSIRVAARDGIVTLQGAVGNILAKERAARQARTVRGVQSVVNRLVVRPTPHLSDDEIAKHVGKALRDDPATDSYEVVALVKDGVATLAGAVQSWRESQLCETVTKGVRGVRGVVNDIDIIRREDRPALEVKGEIESALRWDVFIDHALISVAVEGDTAILSGVVGSAAEKHLAMAKAMTRGVRQVDADDLDVRHWAREPSLRQDKYRDVSDGTIRTAIRKALVQDPRVLSFDVTPVVENGLVSLKGTVDNVRAKRAALQNARNTVGVIGVLDLMKVEPVTKQPDAHIQKAIAAALLRDPFAHGHDVTVAVKDGVVRLTGSVDTFFERNQIEDLATRTNGVRAVRNRITVLDRSYAYDPYVDTWDLLLDVARHASHAAESGVHDAALERMIDRELRWSPFVDAERVEIDVRAGVATLTGTVGSWMEWSIARESAYDAGATLVRNELDVSYTGSSSQ